LVGFSDQLNFLLTPKKKEAMRDTTHGLFFSHKMLKFFAKLFSKATLIKSGRGVKAGRTLRGLLAIHPGQSLWRFYIVGFF